MHNIMDWSENAVLFYLQGTKQQSYLKFALYQANCTKVVKLCCQCRCFHMTNIVLNYMDNTQLHSESTYWKYCPNFLFIIINHTCLTSRDKNGLNLGNKKYGK